MYEFAPVPPDAGERHDGGEEEGAEHLKVRHERILRDEQRVMQAYPQIWPKVEQMARQAVAEGRTISTRDLMAGFRSLDLMADGKPLHLSNDHSAIWSRRLVKQHPEWKSHIRMKKSWVDRVVDQL